MSKVNGMRVVLGGLLAGLVIFAGQIAFHWFILGSKWWFFIAISKPLQQAGTIAGYVGPLFLKGIAAIWLYAALSTRFGPGTRGVVITGLGYWAIGDALPTLGYAPLLATHPWLQPFRAGKWITASIVELVLIVLATFVGAWAYNQSTTTTNTGTIHR